MRWMLLSWILQRAGRRRKEFLRPRPVLSGLLDLLSGEPEIGGRGLAALHRHLIVHHLAIVQALEPRRLDGRDVDEHILPAVLWHNEAVAFRCIEPLDRTNSHGHHSFRCASPVALWGNGWWIKPVSGWLP